MPALFICGHAEGEEGGEGGREGRRGDKFGVGRKEEVMGFGPDVER